MNENSPILCQRCGTALVAGPSGGVCPRCAAELLQNTQTGVTGQPGAAPFTPPSVAELAGKFPQLEILELIGKGGMGAVYKARQTQLDRIVALKILPPGIGDDPAFAERFAREARALAKLNHPNIVTIHDFGHTAGGPAKADGGGPGKAGGGLYYLVMEYVDGITLRRLLETRRVSPREALAIVPEICDALQFAHDQGIVHRDIKPENVLLDRRGRVKVADFGLAKLVTGGTDIISAAVASVEPGPEAAAFTEAGKVMGTPQYMAPEQREHPGEVDHRADIYALGVVFYQMLTGELPGKPIEVPSKKVRIDVRLDEIVLRALEQEPELRYQQASIFKTQVETIAHSNTSAAPVTPSHVAPAQTAPAGNGTATPARQQRPPASSLAKLSLGLLLLGLLGTPLLLAFSPRSEDAVAIFAVLSLALAIIFGIVSRSRLGYGIAIGCVTLFVAFGAWTWYRRMEVKRLITERQAEMIQRTQQDREAFFEKEQNDKADRLRELATAFQPPQLRTLAWKDASTASLPGGWRTWHPDGTPVEAPGDLEMMKKSIDSFPGLNGSGPMALGFNGPTVENPRMFYGWISEPAIEGASYTDVTLTDEKGAPIQGAFAWSAANPASALGMVLFGVDFENKASLPQSVKIDFAYTYGPWTTIGGDIPADAPLKPLQDGNATLGEISRSSSSDASISLKINEAQSPLKQYNFIAITKDGEQLDSPSLDVMIGGDPNSQTITFKFPVKPDQVKAFRLVARAIQHAGFTAPLLSQEGMAPAKAPNEPPKLQYFSMRPDNGGDIVSIGFTHPDANNGADAFLQIYNSGGTRLGPEYMQNEWYDCSNQKSGWITLQTKSSSYYRDPAVDLRLAYAMGPWETKKEIPADSMEPVPVGGGVLLTIGTGDHASVTLTSSREPMEIGSEFDIKALLTDGREVGATITSDIGMAKTLNQEFQFAAPLERVKTFILRARPLKIAGFKNISFVSGGLSYGPEVNGLRAALEIAPLDNGRAVSLRYHLRNMTTDKDIQVAYPAASQDDCVPIVEDEQGRPIPVGPAQPRDHSYHPPAQRELLKPGDIASFQGTDLLTTPVAAIGVISAYPYLQAKPGRYTIRCKLQLPGASAGEADPGDWKGELETPPMTIDVAGTEQQPSFAPSPASPAPTPAAPAVPTPTPPPASLAEPPVLKYFSLLQQDTRPAAPAPQTATAPPQFRCLAWLDEMGSSPWRKWAPQGTLLDPKDLHLPDGIDTPSKEAIDKIGTAGGAPRYICLWFSHPLFDAQSIAEVTLLDTAGKPLEDPANINNGTGTYPPTPGNNTGWIVATRFAGRAGKVLPTSQVVLRYSAGPWQYWNDIPPDFSRAMPLDSGIHVTRVGQGDDGKAFVELTRDSKLDTGITQFDFVAVTKDGRSLTHIDSLGTGDSHLKTERYIFDAPLSQVKTFQIRKRPIDQATFTASLDPGPEH